MSEDIRVKTTPVFKIKPKVGKSYQALNLMKQFGFLPETIIIECIPGIKNGFVVRAVLTEAEKQKEDALFAK